MKEPLLMAGSLRAVLASPKPALTGTRSQPSSRIGVVGRWFTVPSPPLLCLILKDVSDTSKDLSYHMGGTNPHIPQSVWGFLNHCI